MGAPPRFNYFPLFFKRYVITITAAAIPPILILFGDWSSVNLGSTNNLTWGASDDTPWSYEIYENSSLVLSDFWNGGNIQYVFEPTTVGLWNVTVVAYDAFGNSAINTVMIEVLPSTGPPEDILIFLIGGLVVGVSIVAFVIIWMKKK